MSYTIHKRTYIFMLLIFSNFIYISCSKQLYPNASTSEPEKSFSNVKSTAEEQRLKQFLAGGTEKSIDNHGTDPDAIIKTARQYMGVPHCMGGTTPKCMDCSGLLMTVFARHNIHLPHNSEEQARYGKIIADMDDLQKGDLVFFIRTYKTSRFITHSGIYLGNRQFIHTSSSKGVSITSLDISYWKEKFIFGTRLLN